MAKLNFLDTIGQVFSDPVGAWDQFRNGSTNIDNRAIAEENLEYQKERNAIEDARYEEETAYNRAWAENEREYNRALQERMFEREDTAVLRQADQLSKLGINPASQQLNGSNSGAVVGGTTQATESGRGGQALNNSFRAENNGFMPALSLISDIASTVNGVSTGQYSRDQLALQNDRMYLENLDYANKLGIAYDGPMSMYGGKNPSNYRTSRLLRKDSGKELYDSPDFKLASGSQLNQEYEINRELSHKRNSYMYDTDSPQGRLIKDLGNLDFVGLAENIMTKFAQTADNIGEKFGKDFGANNTLKKFFDLFR